jgi:small multidrug resistance pump
MPPANPWLLLVLAIAAEVIGTSCLRLSAGMTRPGPTLVVLAAYGTAMLLLAQVVQALPLGLTYALWSGIGILAIVLVGVLAYRQIPTPGQLAGMALITAGVVVVNVSGPAHG